MVFCCCKLQLDKHLNRLYVRRYSTHTSPNHGSSETTNQASFYWNYHKVSSHKLLLRLCSLNEAKVRPSLDCFVSKLSTDQTKCLRECIHWDALFTLETGLTVLGMSILLGSPSILGQGHFWIGWNHRIWAQQPQWWRASKGKQTYIDPLVHRQERCNWRKPALSLYKRIKGAAKRSWSLSLNRAPREHSLLSKWSEQPAQG